MTPSTQVKRSEACNGEPTVANGWYWGRELLGPPSLPASEDFEVRVERVWAHLKSAFFSADEHERLYACLNELLARREEPG